MNEPPEHKAKKSLGQNFLVSQGVISKIVEALEPPSGIPVFEIGPGKGAITAPLAETGLRIAAFEIDRVLAGALRDRFAGYGNVEIVGADIREIDLDIEAGRRHWERYRIAGNIPYLLTSTILIALPMWKMCAGAVIMVQKEVGERILASPGTRECGILSIFMQAYFGISKVASAKAGAFRPSPGVDSVVLGFTPERREGAPESKEKFLSFLKTSFSQRRKKLGTVLRNSFVLGGEGLNGVAAARIVAGLGEASGVDLNKRPEQIDTVEWFRLFAEYGSSGER